MKRFLLILLACIAAQAARGADSTTTIKSAPTVARPPKGTPDGQRFLFVVDISYAMKATDAANRQALFDILFTGLDGQMRAGDTYGLWLFHDQLRAGEFPMQIWDDKDPVQSASVPAKYLREQSYSGKSKPGVFMPRLLNLIKAVGDVNVLVISDGAVPLAGTPFDANIATVYERRKTERVKAEKPFVTLLVARGGAIVSGAVVLAGESLKLPERPAPALAAAGTNKVASVTNAAVAATRPPAQPPAKVEAGEPQTSMAFQTQPVVPPKPRVMQFTTRSNVTPVAAPAPTNHAVPAPASPTNVQATVPPPAPEPPAPAPVITETITPLPVAARETMVPIPPDARPITPETPGVTATAMPAPASPTSAMGGTLMIAFGAAMVASCLGLTLMVMRRTRPRHQVSAITRSMERL